MKNFLPFILILSLSACAAPYAAQVTEKEHKLWKEANQRVSRECSPAYPRADRAKALDADRCVAGVVRSSVLPHAPFPDLVEKLIQDQSVVSKNYFDGKIDLDRANAEAQQLQARYQAEVMQRLHGGAAN